MGFIEHLIIVCIIASIIGIAFIAIHGIFMVINKVSKGKLEHFIERMFGDE